jgi:hypothetical protein
VEFLSSPNALLVRLDDVERHERLARFWIEAGSRCGTLSQRTAPHFPIRDFDSRDSRTRHAHLISKPVATLEGVHLVVETTISTATWPVSHGSAPFQRRLAPFQPSLIRRPMTPSKSRSRPRSRRPPLLTASTWSRNLLASSKPDASRARRSCNSILRASDGGTDDDRPATQRAPITTRSVVTSTDGRYG